MMAGRIFIKQLLTLSVLFEDTVSDQQKRWKSLVLCMCTPNTERVSWVPQYVRPLRSGLSKFCEKSIEMTRVFGGTWFIMRR